MTDAEPLKFVGRSRKALSEFPARAKALKGFGGASVVELIEDFDGNTYRCVYTTRIKDLVVVLHAFQKKSKTGISTPQFEIDLVKNRLRDAEEGRWK